jgi:tRNA A-37 threonylcarbamoyl transferase component Bud32/uncharacterized membrane protein
LLDHRSEDPWVLKKFRQEMQLLARLDHPGIVAALDFGQLPDSKPFLVMQFVRGSTLRQEITPRGMDLERVGRIVRQLGQALTAAHDSRICHRDVKPENIMLQILGESEEQAKLLDFGIASVRDSLITGSKDSSLMSGSWGYMAPEQFEGKSSSASDIYAMAVVAYEMVTGRTPFNGESPAEFIKLQLEGLKVKPKDLRPRLPETAQEPILKALSTDPAARYARARDFGEALAQALNVLEPAGGGFAQPEAIVEQSMEIAHILYMDLVAYSLLPMDQQTKHLGILQQVVSQTGDFRKAEAANQLMKLPTGDGMALVFFGDPVQPVRCALSITSALRAHPDVKLRMGVHSGPVFRHRNIDGNSNVAGSGINTAQRVMDCGDANHILLSRTVAETIGQLSTWSPHLQDLGEHPVKHGAKVHLFNLRTGELGNPSLPTKLRGASSGADNRGREDARESSEQAERERLQHESAVQEERERLAKERAHREEQEQRNSAAAAERDRIEIEKAAQEEKRERIAPEPSAKAAQNGAEPEGILKAKRPKWVLGAGIVGSGLVLMALEPLRSAAISWHSLQDSDFNSISAHPLVLYLVYLGVIGVVTALVATLVAAARWLDPKRRESAVKARGWRRVRRTLFLGSAMVVVALGGITFWQGISLYQENSSLAPLPVYWVMIALGVAALVVAARWLDRQKTQTALKAQRRRSVQLMLIAGSAAFLLALRAASFQWMTFISVGESRGVTLALNPEAGYVALVVLVGALIANARWLVKGVRARFVR